MTSSRDRSGSTAASYYGDRAPRGGHGRVVRCPAPRRYGTLAADQGTRRIRGRIHDRTEGQASAALAAVVRRREQRRDDRAVPRALPELWSDPGRAAVRK